MNVRQMKWAEQHDWFIRSRRTPYGTYIVLCRASHAGEENQEFTDFQELRAWAGY
jgi:hypothetical protein